MLRASLTASQKMSPETDQHLPERRVYHSVCSFSDKMHNNKRKQGKLALQAPPPIFIPTRGSLSIKCIIPLSFIFRSSQVGLSNSFFLNNPASPSFLWGQPVCSWAKGASQFSSSYTPLSSLSSCCRSTAFQLLYNINL